VYFLNVDQLPYFCKGLSIKDVRSQGERLSSADILRTRDEGGFQMPASAPENFGLFKIDGVSVRTRGRK